MVTSEIRHVIERYIVALEEQGVKVDQAYVFGSQVEDRANRDSDIDVAVVSPAFGKDRIEEGILLRRIAWRIDSRLDPVPLTGDAFDKSDWIPLVHEIKTSGVPIRPAA
jgi:predicted nucleotidyltransferase